MSDIFPVVLGTCLDAEAIWVGRAPENLNKRVLLSRGALAIHEGLTPLLDVLEDWRSRRRCCRPRTGMLRATKVVGKFEPAVRGEQ